MRLHLDLARVVQKREVHRLVTAPLISGHSLKEVFITFLGLHVGTWFVVASYRHRWHKILWAYMINYLFVIGLAYTFDKESLFLP